MFNKPIMEGKINLKWIKLIYRTVYFKLFEFPPKIILCDKDEKK